MKKDITQDEIKRILDYNIKSGEITWKKRDECSRGWNSRWEGKIAGNKRNDGYISIRIKGKLFYAHRIAWMYCYGEFSNSCAHIDHVNGNPSDNRIENLREATVSENMQNQRAPRRNNKSGFLGVSLHKKTGKFKARIVLKNKETHLGLFETAEDASEAYINAKREIHTTCTI